MSHGLKPDQVSSVTIQWFTLHCLNCTAGRYGFVCSSIKIFQVHFRSVAICYGPVILNDYDIFASNLLFLLNSIV